MSSPFDGRATGWGPATVTSDATAGMEGPTNVPFRPGTGQPGRSGGPCPSSFNFLQAPMGAAEEDSPAAAP